MNANAPQFLITGSTSKLGVELVRSLLESTNAHLWLLIRKKPEARNPERRFELAVRQIDSAFSLGKYQSRIRIFAGDITKRHLGVNDEDFEKLMKARPSEVYHLAAFTDRRHFSKDTLFNVNFEGTQRLQKFCQKIGVKIFNHVSWLYAGDDSRDHEDYLNFLERARDFSNMNEFVQRLTTATLIRQCRESGMAYRVVQPGSFMDIEEHSRIQQRWYYYVCRTVFDLVAGYRKVGDQRATEIAFPAADVPIHVTTPRYTAQVITALGKEGVATMNQVFDIWNERLSVRALLLTISKEFPHIRFRFDVSPDKLPLLEKFLLSRSIIFFEYLLKHRIFMPDPRIEELRLKYRIAAPHFGEAELRSLTRECSRLYRLDPDHLVLPWPIKMGLRLMRKTA